MGCYPIRVSEEVRFLVDKTISKSFLQDLCNYIAQKIFTSLQVISSKTRNISITKIGSDFFYQIYANRYPLGMRWFDTVELLECPGLPSLIDKFNQQGYSFFPEGLRFTYEEGLKSLKNLFVGEIQDVCGYVIYASQHYKEYEDPQFRKAMARRYLQAHVKCSAEEMKERDLYGFVVSRLCQKEVNELYWRGYQDKIMESERQLFLSIKKALSTGGLIEDSPDTEDSPDEEQPNPIIDGYPPYTIEVDAIEERLQTPEEHRLEWDQMPLLTKIDKFMLMPISNKEKVGFIIGCWIFHQYVLKRLLV